MQGEVEGQKVQNTSLPSLWEVRLSSVHPKINRGEWLESKSHKDSQLLQSHNFHSTHQIKRKNTRGQKQQIIRRYKQD